MQQPPLPQGYPMPPLGDKMRPKKQKQPLLVWFFIIIFVGTGLIGIGTTIYKLIVPSPQARAYVVYHFDKENQGSVADSSTFEAQGVLHIYYSCDYSIDIGEDVIFEVKRLDVEKVVWRKNIDCPHTDGAMITIESGRYVAAVYASGDVNWTFSVYQTL